MNTRTRAALSRRLAALTITAGIALGTTGCPNDGPRQDPATTAASSAGHAAPGPQREPADTPLAVLQGRHGLSLTVTAAERDPAGCLTIRGSLNNDAPRTVVLPAQLRGDDLNVYRTGPSLAGATVVDIAHGKRYYVLRPCHHPLTTTGLSTLKAGESVRVFMQFPAPPANTSTVGLQLPTFDTANIKISRAR